jgi:N-methylhydantoinase B
MQDNVPMAADVITLDVISQALPAISNEMAADLQRSSYNMMIYEVQDFCCTLLGPDGELLSQNVGGVSHFVADMGVVIRDGVKRYGKAGFAVGDVIIHNHQRVGGQHLNNVCIYTPIFWNSGLVGFAAIRAHWVDVGGLSTGFGAYQLSFDPWVEGLQLDQLKLWREGKLDEQLYRMIHDNIRMPDASFGDLRAQVSACQFAGRRFVELISRYGLEVVTSAIERMFSLAEERCRAVVREIPDGEYEASSFLDPQGTDREPINIHVRVTVKDSSMTIDLSGCSGQRSCSLNSRTLAGGLIAYKALTTPLEPVNEGSFAAVNVIIPEGNIMMASYPAAMGAWSIILPSVVETILLAMASAIPERIAASHHSVLGPALVFSGINERGQQFVSQTIEGGGWGGRPWEDGPSASVSICQGDVRNAPIENLELKVPLLIEQRALEPDSGGAGKFRGGLGTRVRARNLQPGKWILSQSPRRELPPWGMNGGQAGKVSDCLLRKEDGQPAASIDPNDAIHEVAAGSTVELVSAGGGGWGNALEREPAKVLDDVRAGYISCGSAESDYGVLLNNTLDRVDIEGTARLRATLLRSESAHRCNTQGRAKRDIPR